MMAPLPPALKHCFSDYSMNLTCITDEPPQNFSHPDVYALFEITQMICRKDQKGLQEKYSHIGIDQDVFDAVKSITALDIKPVPDSKGGKVKMWTSVNEWQQEIYKSGQEAARRELIAHMLENHWDANTIHQATTIPLGEIREVARELQH